MTGSVDSILDAVAADHDINTYINLLRRDDDITMVGAPDKPLPINVSGLLMGRRSFSGSIIGGNAENPGDARFLRPEQHHRRCGGDPDPENQRSLR